jgi:hypothetical protein
MLFALLLMAANPAPAPADTAPAASAGQSATTSYTPRADSEPTDSAVPLDWAGPAARRPGADVAVQDFNPDTSIFGPADMCVSVPGQPAPACAAQTSDGLQVTADIFAGNNNPDSTCQSVESTRIGSDGKPQRVFATVCGDEAESWSYRQRSTPASRANPTRATNRNIGPNETTAAARSPRN